MSVYNKNTIVSTLEEYISNQDFYKINQLLKQNPHFTQLSLFYCLKHVQIELFLDLIQSSQFKIKSFDQNFSTLASSNCLSYFFKLAKLEDFKKIKTIIPWEHFLSSESVNNSLAQEKWISELKFLFNYIYPHKTDFSRFIHSYINSCIQIGEINNLKETFVFLKQKEYILEHKKILLSSEQINYYFETLDFTKFINEEHILYNCINNGNIDNLIKYKYLIKSEDEIQWQNKISKTFSVDIDFTDVGDGRKLSHYRDDNCGINLYLSTIKSLIEQQLIQAKTIKNITYRKAQTL